MATHLWLLILLVVLSTISVSADDDVFIMSIDCGASDDFTDYDLINWTGDNNFTKNGFSHNVKSDFMITPVYNRLRAFNNTRKKNCYSKEVEEGEKVLVRVVFNYGNYDGNNYAPTFDLHFNGNKWITVNTSEPKFYEAIYVVKGKVVSVCVARTDPNQDPFITSLEVRRIDLEAYNDIGSEYALLTNYRIGYNLLDTIRFPDDVYDRVWHPPGGFTGLELVNNIEPMSFTTYDYPPESLFASAIVARDNYSAIVLDFGDLVYPFDYPLYINWYFTEVSGLTANGYRSFTIYKDDQPISSPIVLGSGNVSEITTFNFSVTETTSFSIVATHDSIYTPLINAIEIFSISNLTGGTNDDDVEGLENIKHAFEVLQDWGGDPCLPSPYSWDWIECNNDTRPRVISLNLSGYNLVGTLPNFEKMDALEIIDLHNNSISGPLDFLGKLPNLTQLNLADNKFTGSIPRSLSGNSQLNLSYMGNSLSMGSSINKKKTLPVVLAITILVFFNF